MGINMGGHNQQFIMKGISPEAAEELANKFKGEAELWQKRFEEKEKECEFVKKQGEYWEIIAMSYSKQIEELKAENENIKDGLGTAIKLLYDCLLTHEADELSKLLKP